MPRKKPANDFGNFGIPTLSDFNIGGGNDANAFDIFGMGNATQPQPKKTKHGTIIPGKIFKKGDKRFIEDPDRPGHLVRFKKGKVVKRGRPFKDTQKKQDIDLFGFTLDTPQEQNMQNYGNPKQNSMPISDLFGLGGIGVPSLGDSFGGQSFDISFSTMPSGSAKQSRGKMGKKQYRQSRGGKRGVGRPEFKSKEFASDLLGAEDPDLVRNVRDRENEINLDPTIRGAKIAGRKFNEFRKRWKRKEPKEENFGDVGTQTDPDDISNFRQSEESGEEQYRKAREEFEEEEQEENQGLPERRNNF